jgi:hypothetical protein
MSEPVWREWREASRRQAIRAVVAAQWAVACSLFSDVGGRVFVDPVDVQNIRYFAFTWPGHGFPRIAALPTPEEIVDGAV